MLKIKHLILYIIFVATIISCTKSDSVPSTPTSFIGTWTISKTYGNDVWGAPYYWKDADGKTKIKFTTDGKYFRKYSSDNIYTLIGGFQVKSDSTITIIPDSINGNVNYPYTLYYKFEIGGFMTWGNFATEGIVKEKFIKD